MNHLLYYSESHGLRFEDGRELTPNIVMWQHYHLKIQADGDSYHIVCDDADYLDVLLYGDEDGSVKLSNANQGTAVRDGIGEGNAVRTGGDLGDAIRKGGGSGWAECDTAFGNAVCMNVRRGSAYRIGDGIGDAIVCLAPVPNAAGDAYRSGSGHGNAIAMGKGRIEIKRTGEGFGHCYIIPDATYFVQED